MNSKASVENFLSKKNIAIVGVSRSGEKMGNAINKGLREKGYNTFIVNPNTDSIESQTSYPNLKSISNDVEAVLTCLPPSETESVVKDMVESGLNSVWMQQGSQFKKAIKTCQENSIDYVAGECIFMFAEPVKGGHKFHRTIWGWLGKLPK